MMRWPLAPVAVIASSGPFSIPGSVPSNNLPNAAMEWTVSASTPANGPIPTQNREDDGPGSAAQWRVSGFMMKRTMIDHRSNALGHQIACAQEAERDGKTIAKIVAISASSTVWIIFTKTTLVVSRDPSGQTRSRTRLEPVRQPFGFVGEVGRYRQVGGEFAIDVGQHRQPVRCGLSTAAVLSVTWVLTAGSSGPGRR